tara:strand:- start:87 stop:479 length:393 start_codon:yes stop_codon:yes gene_type:complete
MKLETKIDIKSLTKHLLDDDEDTVLTFMLDNKTITPLDGYSFDDSLYGKHIYDLKKVILKLITNGIPIIDIGQKNNPIYTVKDEIDLTKVDKEIEQCFQDIANCSSDDAKLNCNFTVWENGERMMLGGAA